MACTGFYPDLGHKWLTSIGKDAKQGDLVTLSMGHPLMGGEFTTFRLPCAVGANQWGEPLFDLDEAHVSLRITDNGAGVEFYPISLLRRIREERSRTCAAWRGFILGGKRYRWGSFGNAHLERPEDVAADTRRGEPVELVSYDEQEAA